MIKPTTTASLWAAVFFVLSPYVLAQAAVRDSSPAVATPAPVAATVAEVPATNQAYQIQQLQQEVLELRGLLEEQAFEIKRLKQQRLDDYLDLDKRLRELNSVADQAASTVKPKDVAETSNDTTDEEKALYSKAIDLLLSQQDYKSAKNSFQQYLSQYPQGAYAPNVYYWQGQILLTEGKKSDAADTFAALIERYPDHQKTPDAKYKLATVYFDLNKKSEAKKLLEAVAASDTDAARLAKAFLTKHY